MLDNSFIEQIASKYGYPTDLTDALKRIIPAMTVGRSQDEIRLLMDTLERVEIFVFDETPSQEALDQIEKRKVAGRNDHITESLPNDGEYGKKATAAAYLTQAIYDEAMNVVDRVGFIHITRLPKAHSQTADYFDTTINLSHLIHELGHAWASQKDEYTQDEEGNVSVRCGLLTRRKKIDRANHTVESISSEGLFLEEAFNTTNEELALQRLFGIESIESIPGYQKSIYQSLGFRAFIDFFYKKFSENSFFKGRIDNDSSSLDIISGIFRESSFFKSTINTPEHRAKRKKEIMQFEESALSENATMKLHRFFDQYSNIFFPQEDITDVFKLLDVTLNQLFNLNSVKFLYSNNPELFSNTLNTLYAPMEDAMRNVAKMPMITLRQIAEQIQLHQRTKNPDSEQVQS